MTDNLRQRLDDFSAAHAPFDNHYFHLGEGVWTLDSLNLDRATLGRLNLDASHFRLTYQVKQALEALRSKEWAELRVLDLGTAEGMHAVEFGLTGAREVIGIEGREENARKASFACELLGLDNVDVRCHDVRDLDPAEHEPFDVILCLGLVYHLEFDDAVALLRKLRRMLAPRGVMFLETLYAGLDAEAVYRDGEHVYRGHTYREHEAGASVEEMRAGTSYRSRRAMLAGGRYSSIGNEFACMLDKPSLASLLGNVGFRNVWEIWEPSWNYGQRTRRVTLACLPAERVPMHAAPQMDVNRERPPFLGRERYAPFVCAPRLGVVLRLARWVLRYQLAYALACLRTMIRDLDVRR